MAAAYLFHLAKNHPFVDGNKRVALAAATTFLDLNGIEVTASNAALHLLAVRVATGEFGISEIAEFFRDHAIEPQL